MKYACIQAHRGEFDVSLMCRVFGVSRAGFHAAQKRGVRQRERSDQRLRLEIRSIHWASQHRYGSPRVYQELKAQGIRCARKRAERLMREDGLVAKPRRRFRSTTESRHAYPIAANLLERRFAVGEIEGVDRVWVSDITYLPTREGWLYLAVVLDLGAAPWWTGR